jgi:hypothetical protein
MRSSDNSWRKMPVILRQSLVSPCGGNASKRSILRQFEHDGQDDRDTTRPFSLRTYSPSPVVGGEQKMAGLTSVLGFTKGVLPAVFQVSRFVKCGQIEHSTPKPSRSVEPLAVSLF